MSDELLARGFAMVRGGAYAELRAHVFGVYQAHGEPSPFAEQETRSGACLINPTGFVIPSLLAECPEAAPWVLGDAVLDIARAALGDDMHLEMLGANITDASRPFFDWHQHIGGIDVEEVRALGIYPRFERSERLIAVTYLDAIDGDGGEILVVPRAIDEATEPLGAQTALSWPREVVVHLDAGDTLVLEQCTWHSVRPMRRDGMRAFVGAYLTASCAARTRAVDASLEAEGVADRLPPHLRALVQARPERA